MKRPIVFLVAASLLLSACGVLTGDDTSLFGSDSAGEPERTSRPATEPPAATITPSTPPPTTAGPPAGTLIDTLIIDDVTFELFDEGGSCLVVSIESERTSSLTERRCFTEFVVVAATPSCAPISALAMSTATAVNAAMDRAAPQVVECDEPLPPVFFGRVTSPDVGYVCMGAIGSSEVDAGVEAARFLETSRAGVIFEPVGPNESPRAAHLYGPRGNHYGDPPLDAPSGYIYDRCDLLAPWGDTGVEYHTVLNIYFDTTLRNDSVTVWFDAGLGTAGISGAASDEVPAEFDVVMPAASRGLVVGIHVNDAEALPATTFAWPAAVREILSRGVPCAGPISVDVTIAGSAVEGDPQAITIAFSSAECA